MSGYLKSFDETMYMSFFIKGKKLLEKKKKYRIKLLKMVMNLYV